jgi:broad specificity polyphosphatase/5'/3'-nucleotidase SurE
VRKDPRGRAYYWLFGERLASFPQNTDADAVLSAKRISITPLALNMSGPISEGLQSLKERVESRTRTGRPKAPAKSR